jgi:hypothetical protein
MKIPERGELLDAGTDREQRPTQLQTRQSCWSHAAKNRPQITGRTARPKQLAML